MEVERRNKQVFDISSWLEKLRTNFDLVVNLSVFQAISLAKLYTRQYDNTIKEFSRILETRAMFFNPHPFPANESDEAAFFRCNNEEASRLFYPNRWKAMKAWIEATTKVNTCTLSKNLDD